MKVAIILFVILFIGAVVYFTSDKVMDLQTLSSRTQATVSAANYGAKLSQAKEANVEKEVQLQNDRAQAEINALNAQAKRDETANDLTSGLSGIAMFWCVFVPAIAVLVAVVLMILAPKAMGEIASTVAELGDVRGDR